MSSRKGQYMCDSGSRSSGAGGCRLYFSNPKSSKGKPDTSLSDGFTSSGIWIAVSKSEMYARGWTHCCPNSDSGKKSTRMLSVNRSFMRNCKRSCSRLGAFVSYTMCDIFVVEIHDSLLAQLSNAIIIGNDGSLTSRACIIKRKTSSRVHFVRYGVKTAWSCPQTSGKTPNEISSSVISSTIGRMWWLLKRLSGTVFDRSRKISNCCRPCSPTLMTRMT